MVPGYTLNTPTEKFFVENSLQTELEPVPSFKTSRKLRVLLFFVF